MGGVRLCRNTGVRKWKAKRWGSLRRTPTGRSWWQRHFEQQKELVWNWALSAGAKPGIGVSRNHVRLSVESKKKVPRKEIERNFVEDMYVVCVCSGRG